ncbi:TonB-dependent receptor domain-containing protein [Leptolyngbya sp. AN03gr2]
MSAKAWLWAVVPFLALLQGVKPADAQVSRLPEIESISTAAGTVVAQAPPTVERVNITDVQVRSTENGLALQLTTAPNAALKPIIQTSGNRWIATFENAALALPSGQSFQANNPTAEISQVQVQQVSNIQVQVEIISKSELPNVEIAPTAAGLSLTVLANGKTSSDTATRSDAESEEEEVVVTATRTEEPLKKVPRSITIINRQQIEEQSRLTRNLGDILANTVPGFSAPTQRTNTFGSTLRGRGISVLIDGVPQNGNLQSLPTQLTSIDPSAIERIEIVRGPNSIYGGQATGGTINIITRKPSNQLTSTLELGTTTALTGSEDKFGYNLQYQLSAKQGAVDLTTGIGLTTTGTFYDAEGDRIANSVSPDDTQILNGLLKVGVDLDPQQRLQFTATHYNNRRNNNLTEDASIDVIPGIQKARTLAIDGLQILGTTEGSYIRNTNVALDYTHQNLFGSKVQGQVYYRNNAFRGSGIPFDGRDFLGVIGRTPGESEQFGTRLQVNTPFNPDKTLQLLWGVDYNNEKSFQNIEVFDPEAFDASGGSVFRKIAERTFVPRYTVNDLGLFAQLQWDANDRLNLSGGLRYVNLGLKIDDYVTINDQAVQGGDRQFDTVAFNAGATYQLSDQLSAFASFSQGFSVPSFGFILREPPSGFTRVTDAIRLTEPQKVNNYEVGLRGRWSTVQASISGFYNTSDLGEDFRLVNNNLEIVRAPQRTYGVEATLDWQATKTLSFGGTLTWQEGENDEDEDGNFLALNSITVPPVKLTAYVENETLPGWRNRLQLLYSGNRDRAFQDGVDGGKISSYVTLDFISRIQLGQGELQIGIQNLLNTQYFPVYSQYFAPFFDSANYAGQGRTLSVTYRVTF